MVFVAEHVEEGRFTEHAQYMRNASTHSHSRFKMSAGIHITHETL